MKKISKSYSEHPRSFRVRNYNRLHKLLTSIQENQVNELVANCTNLEEENLTFKCEVLYYAEKFIPIKTITPKSNSKPFLKPDTKHLINKKADSYRIFKQSGLAEDLNVYEDLTKQVKKAINMDRADWLSDELQENSSSKIAWSKAREIMGKSTSLSPRSILINNDIVTNPKKISEAYADFHLKKLKELRNKSPKNPIIEPVVRLKNWLEKSGTRTPRFSLKPIAIQKLDKLINRLKAGKNLPDDDIDGYTMKSIYPLVKDGVLNIVNLSLTTGTFAQDWKQQIISPHHKKGDKTLLDNFNQVSTIIEMGKIVEMEVHDQTIDHFITNELLHPAHHGSISNLDTTTALLKVNNYANEAAEVKKATATVLLDQSCAFEIIDHIILLGKLRAYNFCPINLSWFTSYLANRSYIVKIDSKLSDSKNLDDFGVPQGSVLGSLLFVISQNDLPGANDDQDKGMTTCFVDDKTEQESDTNIDALHIKIQNRVKNATEWLKDNQMIIRPDKSKLLLQMTANLRAHKPPSDSFKATIDDFDIQPTENERLLGVSKNQDLTWSHHL